MCTPTTSALSCCQICFDQVPAPEASSTHGRLVTQLCGPQCWAQICQSCLTWHVQVSLERFYAGVVPKVRCPICLTPMLKSQWAIHLQDEEENKAHELVQRFETLCKQACGLTSPCCDKPDYTHLPEVACHSEDQDQAEVTEALMAVCPEAQEHIAPLWALCQDFHSHKNVAARTVVEFVLQHFGGNKALDVIDQILPRLRDDERRATLQLAYLYVRPSVWSRCCGRAFCFNCKRKEHHKVCDQEQAVDMETCLIQCRSCRATLLKVDGCELVTCLCGFSMEWDEEIKFKEGYEKKTIPVDIYDIDLFEVWIRWKRRLTIFIRPDMHEAYLKFRQSRMAPWLDQHKQILTKHLAPVIWRRRFSKHVVTSIPWAVSCLKFADWRKQHQTLAQRTLVRLVWQHRFTRTVLPQLLMTVRLEHAEIWIQTNKPLLQRTLIRMMWQRRFTRRVRPQMLACVRRQQVDAWIKTHKTLLQPAIMRVIWKKRFTKQVVHSLPEAVNLVNKTWAIKCYRPQLRIMLCDYIWRRRFTSIVASQQIYWAVYYLQHRGEEDELAEDEFDMFNMSFDD